MLGRKADGKPNRPTIYGQSQADVLAQINELKYEYNHGLYVEPNRMKRWGVAPLLAKNF